MFTLLKISYETMMAGVTIRHYIHGFTSCPCTFGGVDGSAGARLSKRTRPVSNQIQPHCREIMGPRTQYGDHHRPQIERWLDLPIVDMATAPSVLAIREGNSSSYQAPENEAEITHMWSHLILEPLNHVMKLLYQHKYVRTRIEMRIRKSQKGGNDNQASGQFPATTPDFSFVAPDPDGGGGEQVVMMTTEIKPSINNDVLTTMEPEIPQGKTLSAAVIK
ncbi:MAG: hypothetical protein Q9184_004931 [Pyrenodesmia sp. 2 TL-2023]